MAETANKQPAFAAIIAKEINGVHTDFVFHKFANKYFIIVTQYEKISNVFVASNENVVTGIVSKRSFNVQHKFGKTTDEIECAIQYLATSLQLDMDAVITLSLKECNRTIVNEIKGVLENLMDS